MAHALTERTVSSATQSDSVLTNVSSTDPISVAVDLGGGTMTYTVQFTLQDPRKVTSPTWYNSTVLFDQTANATENIASRVAAVRLNVTAYTSGTATLQVLESTV